MLFHESVEDSIEGEGHWGQPHPTQFVLPVAHFLRCEPDVAALHVVQAGGNVLYLYLLGLVGANLYKIGLEFASGWYLHFGLNRHNINLIFIAYSL